MAETSLTTNEADTRTITALMIIVIVFSLIGNEIEHVESTGSPTKSGNNGLTTSGRIIVGGAIATTLLVLMSHAGRPGRQFSLALATVAFATSTLVYGGPVWRSISSALSSSAGSKGTTSTTPTKPTTPTAGTTQTAASLSNLA